MKKVRILALVLALVLCFSACAQQPAAGGEATQAPTNAPAGNDPTNAPEGPKMYWDMLDEVTESAELPDWEGKPLEITLWLAGGTQTAPGATDPNGTAVWEEIARITGVRLNYNTVFNNGGNNITAKMPQVIASGDLPTIMSGWDITGEMKELFANEYLLDLTPYLEAGVLDHHKENFGWGDLDAQIWSQVRTADGKYFGLPSGIAEAFLLQNNMTNCGYDPEAMAKSITSVNTFNNDHYNHQFYIRDDILKAVRPDAKTWKDIVALWEANEAFTEADIYDMGFTGMDAWMDFLREVKAVVGDFKGLDGSTCEVTSGPASDNDNWEWMNYWPHLTDGRTNSDPFLYAVKDPASPEEIYAYTFEDGYMKDFAAKLNTLVREDIIAQNSLVDNTQTLNEKRLNAHYAVIHSWLNDQIITELNAASDEWDYRPIVINGEFGSLNTIYTCPLQTITVGAFFKDAIPEDQVEQLLRAVDFLSSEVGANLVYYGPKSLGLYEIAEDGSWSFTDQYCIDVCFNGEANKDKFLGEYGLGSQSGVQGFGIGGGGIRTFVNHPVQNRSVQNPQDPEKAFQKFTAGYLDKYNIVKGQSVGLFTNDTLYSSGQAVEGFKTFWAQRPAYEAQMKRAIAAATPEAFEEEWEALALLCIEAGLTPEALVEYNTTIIYERNKGAFDAVGMFQ